MNLFSDSALLLRSRSVWEAADSGILLWRNSFAYFIPFFALPVIITACLLRLIPPESRVLSYLILWWLKPLFDRLALHVVAARFFRADGDSPSLFGGLWAMRRGLVGDLLWRRFSSKRAAAMPVRVLERVGGRQFRLRKKALAAGGLNFCTLITVMGLALEAFLLLSKTAFVALLTQMFFPVGLDFLLANREIIEALLFAAFCFNYILVGSLYVCMGFGLYINSRVEVEGWDLQLLFRQFAAAARPAAKPILLLCVFLALSPASPLSAAEHDFASLPPPDAAALGILEEVLAAPDFGEYREGWGIRLRERERAERAEAPDPAPAPPWLESVRQVFGYVLMGIALLALAALAAFVLYWYWKNGNARAARSRRTGRTYANPLFSAESPETLFARADDFYRRGKMREAWAACLSACIGAYAKHRSLSFPPDATEYGCLELVRRALPAEAGGFGSLVQNWILFAYGGKSPDQGAFEQSLAYGRTLLTAPAGERRSHEP